MLVRLGRFFPATIALLALGLIAVARIPLSPRNLFRSNTTAQMQLPIRRYHEVVAPARMDAWRIIGPGGGGTFYNASISPHDPNLVFASTDMTSCYVSENGGLTWREFNLRFTCRFTFD